MNDTEEIRTMTLADLSLAVDWAAREGWNPGLEDAEAFFAADPQGFLIAERAGEVIGTISAVSYGRDFGFIGFYIVKPEVRGHRHGLLLAERALSALEGRNIGIDGVLAKQRQYAKFFGFQFAYRNIRYGGVISGRAPGDAMVAASALPFERLAAYDRRFFPAEREMFLRKWIAMSNAKSLVSVRDGQVAGYGVIRRCREGSKIGPLFADDAAIAEELFLALCASVGGGTVFLDVPEVNGAAVRMAERHGLREVFATARMYNREVPDLPLEGIFGVTTFELG